MYYKTRLTLQQKIRITLILTLSIASIIAVLVYARALMMSSEFLHAGEESQVTVSLSNSIHHDLEEAAAFLIELALTGQDDTREAFIKHIELMESKLGFLQSRLPENLHPRVDILRQGIEELKDFPAALRLPGNIASLRHNQNLQRERVRPLLNRLDTVSDELDDAAWKTKESTYLALQEEGSRGALILALLILGGAIFVVFLNTVITRNIIGRVREVITAMEGIATGTGQLTHRLDASGKDEIAQLARAFNQFADKIQSVINLVMESSTVLAKEAENMSSASQENKEGAERQQREINDIAAAVSGMASSVEDVAQSATAAARATRDASKEAGTGRDIVCHTIASIEGLAGDINRAADSIRTLVRESENIDSVLAVINEIADQTNLLALNAAIEAARAGEQGRGFAVVADEVRTLAIRTQEGTVDIKNKINQFRNSAASVAEIMNQGCEKTQDVVQQAAQAGDALQAINESVATIAEMNSNIASATDQQLSMVGEIKQNIASISQIASDTADKAIRTSASNRELSLMAMQLRTLVEQFLLDTTQGPSASSSSDGGKTGKETGTEQAGQAGQAVPAHEAAGEVTLF